jgi:uncharacterized protein YgbK (DUF1537 family)
MVTKTRPNKITPPKPKARKDSPITQEYEARSKKLLREAMAQRSATPEQLSKLLAEIGVEISPGGVANKISKGGFSTSFLMQCLDALDLDVSTEKR